MLPEAEGRESEMNRIVRILFSLAFVMPQLVSAEGDRPKEVSAITMKGVDVVLASAFEKDRPLGQTFIRLAKDISDPTARTRADRANDVVFIRSFLSGLFNWLLREIPDASRSKWFEALLSATFIERAHPEIRFLGDQAVDTIFRLPGVNRVDAIQLCHRFANELRLTALDMPSWRTTPDFLFRMYIAANPIYGFLLDRTTLSSHFEALLSSRLPKDEVQNFRRLVAATNPRNVEVERYRLTADDMPEILDRAIRRGKLSLLRSAIEEAHRAHPEIWGPTGNGRRPSDPRDPRTERSTPTYLSRPGPRSGQGTIGR
jgi:hypothetical protein